MQISMTKVSISVFVKAINDAVNDIGRKKLAATTVTRWLEEQGLLRTEPDWRGKNRRVLTENSSKMGITSKIKEYQFGSYELILYDAKAQKFILDNIQSIIGK